MKENSYYTKNDLMKIFGKGDGAIKEHLANLKKEGKLERKREYKIGLLESIKIRKIVLSLIEQLTDRH